MPQPICVQTPDQRTARGQARVAQRALHTLALCFALVIGGLQLGPCAKRVAVPAASALRRRASTSWRSSFCRASASSFAPVAKRSSRFSSVFSESFSLCRLSGDSDCDSTRCIRTSASSGSSSRTSRSAWSVWCSLSSKPRTPSPLNKCTPPSSEPVPRQHRQLGTSRNPRLRSSSRSHTGAPLR
jgi:hypothetical protein